VIALFGIPIHEPDVVFTDLGLAVLGAYLAWRLCMAEGQSELSRAGAVLMGALASAALWGAIFHAFFPDETATLPGFVAWLPVAFSILIAAATMLELGLRILVPRLPSRVRRSIVAIYAVAFAAVVLLVDESFASIVRFYMPALLLLVIAAAQQATRSRSVGWTLIASGLFMSAGAALLQQAGVSIHPVYFDHNAVYHVIQGIALVFLYLGFRRAHEGSAGAYATGTNPAPGPG
jgi:hypothetical protein